jgi:hypothetical protein
VAWEQVLEGAPEWAAISAAAPAMRRLVRTVSDCPRATAPRAIGS